MKKYRKERKSEEGDIAEIGRKSKPRHAISRLKSKSGADLGIFVGGGGVDIICNTYNLPATPFLQISLSAG